MGIGGQRHAPAALPPGMTRYPLYRRLGGPQGRSELIWKISPPQGFDPRIAQLITSRYTDWAIAALKCFNNTAQSAMFIGCTVERVELQTVRNWAEGNAD
jgi:hypothetical protein